MAANEPNLPQSSVWPSGQAASGKSQGLQYVLGRLTRTLERDRLVQDTLTQVRQRLAVDRLVLYYFFSEWRGQVTAEALGHPMLSILGSTGADDCFNNQHAQLYLAGRTRAITDVAASDLEACHKEFLIDLQVQANLVVPILVRGRLWGLLVAHHCQSPRTWAAADIALLQKSAATLANAPVIQAS